MSLAVHFYDGTFNHVDRHLALKIHAIDNKSFQTRTTPLSMYSLHTTIDFNDTPIHITTLEHPNHHIRNLIRLAQPS